MKSNLIPAIFALLLAFGISLACWIVPLSWFAMFTSNLKTKRIVRFGMSLFFGALGLAMLMALVLMVLDLK